MSSEFESLSDIILARGVKHSEIIASVHDAVLKEFSTRYPKEPGGVEVVVDERTGSVRIYFNRADITPPDFIPVAEKVALRVLIKKLSETESGSVRAAKPSKPSSSSSSSSAGFFKWLINFLFLMYNSLYFLFIAMSLVSLVFNPEYRGSTFLMFGKLGLIKGLIFLLLLSVPFASVYMADRTKRGKSNLGLDKIIFLFEIPLIIIMFISLSFFENATLSMWFFLLMLVCIVVVIFSEATQLVVGKLWQKWVILILKQVAMMTAGYFVLLYSFFIPVFVVGFLLNIIGSFFGVSFGDLVVMSFGLIFLGIFSLFLTSPYLILSYLYKVFMRAHKDFSNLIDPKRLRLAHNAIALIWIASMFIVSYQPHTGFVEKMQKLRSSETFEERNAIAEALIPNKTWIDIEMRNSLNASGIYLMDKENDTLERAYQDVFRFNGEMAGVVQSMFSGLAYPFVYQGTFGEYGTAMENYEYLFGYRFGSDPEALSVKGNVKLVSRETRIKTDYEGLLATVSVEEEYENTTFANQEVLYEFSLPTNSAITDLKLGPNLEFDGLIAPRGAAGKVYQQQKVVRRDPALLEQTGPRQYRLRVFPIPGKNDTTLGGKNLKVKFTYATELTPEGYALPAYTEEKNINKDLGSKKTYYLDEKDAARDVEGFFVNKPVGLGASNKCDLTSSFKVKTSQKDFFTVRLVPYNIVEMSDDYSCDNKTGIDAATSLEGANFAILYDASYSNRNSTFLNDFKKFLSANKKFTVDNEIDLYAFNDILGKKQRVNADWVKNSKSGAYFGKSDWMNQIKKIDKWYDFIVIVTSDTKISENAESFDITYEAPVYIMHENGKIPAYPAGVTNYILQKGGNVSDRIEDVLNHYELTSRSGSKKMSDYVALSPFWGIEISAFSGQFYDIRMQLESFDLATSEGDPLSYLANKAYVTHLLASGKADLEKDDALLDDLNAFAKKAHIVTPFSSMIALVNEQQMEQLRNASDDKDRFTYEAPDTIVNPSQRCDPSTGFFCNPLRSTSSFSSESRSGGAKIPKWGTKRAPSNVQTDILDSGMSSSMMFIVFNVIIVGIAGFGYMTSKIMKKRKK